MDKGLMLKTWEDRRGFTLLEIMIAMFILLVALLGLVSVTVMVIKGGDLSKRMTTATTLAKYKLEEVKNQSYSTITAATTTDYWNEDSSVGTAGAYFTLTTTVTDSSPATNMKTIVVEVRWNWGGRQRLVTLSTIIAA